MSVAEQIAIAVGAARRADGRYETSTLHCHGGDNPTQLVFTDAEGGGVNVWCYTRNCTKTREGRNRARENLRKAAGLPVFRRGKYRLPGMANAARRVTPTKTDAGAQKRWRDAAMVWEFAKVSLSGPDPDSPAGKWLLRFHAWPLGFMLPDAIRWLSESQVRSLPQRVNPGADVGGAFVMGMRRWGETRIRKVAIVAVTRDGDKARDCFLRTDGSVIGDKIMIGSAPETFGWLMHWTEKTWPPNFAPELVVAEGMKDGLALLSGLATLDSMAHWGSEEAPLGQRAWDEARARSPVLCVCHTKVNPNLAERLRGGAWGEVILCPDSDEAGLDAGRKAMLAFAAAGFQGRLLRMPAGLDPADQAKAMELYRWSWN